MRKKQLEKLNASKSDFEKSAKEQNIEVSNGTKLRVLSFSSTPKTSVGFEIMFIPGMLTIFPRWEKVVRELNEHYPVHYIETREKRSSILAKGASMSISDMRKDLAVIEKELGLDDKQYVTISSSMGGSLVLENLAAKTISPKGSILVSPGVEIIFPKIVPPLLRFLPAFVVTLMKPFIRWAVRTFFVDEKKEPEQAKQYSRSVTEADSKKMRRCIIKNANRYDGWPLLPKISDRIILIGASSDKAHKSDFAKKVSKSLSNCTYFDLGTNKAAHDTPLVEVTRQFIAELSKTGPKVGEIIQSN